MAIPNVSTRDRVTLLLFTAIIALLYADQNLLAPNLTLIGQEFGFSRQEIDQKLGADVNLIFWMLGGIVTLLIGYLADRSDLKRGLSRKRMLVLIAIIGQAACFASGLASSFEQLYWARALTGVGVGGAFPLIFSLLGDYFPPQRRAAASAIIGLAMGLGIAMGQTLAGMLSASHGWRVAFFLIAIPGMVSTLLFAFVAKEPARGQQEKALQGLIQAGTVYEERIHLRDIPEIFRIRTNVLIFIQALPGTVPWGVFFVYLNDFYAFDKGFTVAEATLLVMAIGAAAILGGFGGGLIGQLAFNRSSKYLPLLCAVTTLTGVLPMAILISYPVSPATPLEGPLLVGVLTGLLVAVTGPNVNTMLINVNPPERRGAAFSLFNLFNDLGRGFGAWVVGMLASQLGRVPAFHIANGMWVFCGIVLLLAVRSFSRDEEALQQFLAKRVCS